MFRLLSLLCINNNSSNKIMQLVTTKASSTNLVATEESDKKVQVLLEQLFHNNIMSSIEFSSIANNLYPYMSNSYISYQDKVRLLQICADKAIRHEGIICKCIWDVLKTKLESSNEMHKIDNSKEELRSKVREESYECQRREEFNYLQVCQKSLHVTRLAENTAVTFRIMCEFGFVNDTQMLLLALGRCIELAHELSISGIAEAYRALTTLNKTHLSLTDAALEGSNVTMNFSLTENQYKSFEFDDEELLQDDCRSITTQPNLIDVLCGELENRLIELYLQQRCLWVHNQEHLNNNKSNKLASNDSEFSTEIACGEETEELLNNYSKLLWCDMKCKSHDVIELYQKNIATILRGMAITGISNASSIKAIKYFIQHIKCLQLEFLIDAFRETSAIFTRVVDVLEYSVETDVEVECNALIEVITHKLLAHRQIVRELRRKPELVLELRRIFEINDTLYEHASELWDVLRCIHISYKRVEEIQRSKYSALPVKRLGGKLFEPKYAITKSTLAEHSQRPKSYNYTPPEFRKENSLKMRGRQRRRGRISSSPYQRFGVRRIKSTYIHSLRRKYAPTFW